MNAWSASFPCPNCGDPYTVFRLYCQRCGCIMPGALRDEGEITQLLSGNQAIPVNVEWGRTYFHPFAHVQFRIKERNQVIAARLDKSPIFMGRANPSFVPQVAIPLVYGLTAGISRIHARLDRMSTRLYVTDLDSTNGTFLDGQRLTPQVAYLLHNGAALQLGSLILRVEFL